MNPTCSKCQRVLSPGGRFCEACGQPAAMPQPAPSAPPPNNLNPLPAPPPFPPVQPQAAAPQPAEPPPTTFRQPAGLRARGPKPSLMMPLIIAGVVLVLVIGGAVWYVVSRGSQDQKAENSNGESGQTADPLSDSISSNSNNSDNGRNLDDSRVLSLLEEDTDLCQSQNLEDISGHWLEGYGFDASQLQSMTDVFENTITRVDVCSFDGHTLERVRSPEMQSFLSEVAIIISGGAASLAEICGDPVTADLINDTSSDDFIITKRYAFYSQLGGSNLEEFEELLEENNIEILASLNVCS